MHRLLSLSWRQRWLLVRATALVVAVRICLQLLPFRHVRRLVTRLSRPGPATGTPTPPEDVAWAVGAASRRLLGDKVCLTQALAAQILLAGTGRLTRLCLGVAKGAAGSLEAHAWLESEGEVIVGGWPVTLSRYTRLPDLGSLEP